MPVDGMSAADFAAWVEHMRRTRNWTKRECARQIRCGKNQIQVWSQEGAPLYIGYACAALADGLPPWQARRETGAFALSSRMLANKR